MKYLKARYVSEKAQGIVEYALILAFVAVIAAALFTNNGIKDHIVKIFENISSLLQNGEAASSSSGGK
ncbi:Flp family type IVb pilin [Mitsuokella sp. AF21-1AC]|uniref:Flp family type IVb pilin n=1 Tax=Mitsuokella sp. AF21-1AC TaxID=2292235 RepID=UPI000E53BC3A|nr:pilin protein [Mitsuokella sp. AF21-1AC]RGS72510.1 pilin protein [Mitsuokella sp. AF21-1AC]